MKYRPLGRTGLYVSELCPGTMTFGGQGEIWKKIGQLAQTEVNGLVAHAFEKGVNFIDTADVYSEGRSEELLGQALKDLKAVRSEIVVATKVLGRSGPGVNDVGLSRGHIMSAVEASLKRLQTDYIDLYQIHGNDRLTPLDETLAALDNLVRRGLVRYTGCSNLPAWRIVKALGISQARGLARFESVQAYYTVATRDLEREIIPAIADCDLGLMVWSPLAGGFLSGKFSRSAATPNDARRSGFDFPPVNRERAYDLVDAMRPMAEQRGASVARIALAWLLHQKAVTTVIVGAKTVAQLDDNLRATEVSLTEAELAELDRLSALVPEYPQWMLAFQGSAPRPGLVPRSFQS